jgi:hypothetical protein
MGMTKTKAKPVAPPKKGTTIELTQGPNDNRATVLAQAVLGQNLRHGHVASVFAGSLINANGETLDVMECAKVVQQRATDAKKGDLTFVSAMLASQAVSLDTVFTELARRAAMNMGQYVEATDRFMRLALKAQAASRATLEALARVHQPREQTVRHVHVERGGQAVVADQFHHHAGGSNEKAVEQSHATAIAG